MLEAERKWMIANPNGSKEELKLFLDEYMVFIEGGHIDQDY
jgi:hypothetical protein